MCEKELETPGRLVFLERLPFKSIPSKHIKTHGGVRPTAVWAEAMALGATTTAGRTGRSCWATSPGGAWVPPKRAPCEPPPLKKPHPVRWFGWGVAW